MDRRNLANRIFIQNPFLFLCAVAALCVPGCIMMTANNQRKNVAKIRQLDAQYKDGATLLEKQKTRTGRTTLYLDTDGNTNTTELVVEGGVFDNIDERLLKETRVGDKKSIEAWARYLNTPKARVLEDRLRHRF